MYHANNPKKKEWLYQYHKKSFRAQEITEIERYINAITKWFVHQENITILNVCAPIKIGEEYVKQKLMELKGKRNKSTIMVREFNTPHSTFGRTTRLKSSKGIEL